MYREFGDGDVWDATLLMQWTLKDMLSKLPLSLSSDAAVLQTWKKRSFSPVVGQLLSLPPHLRQTFNGKFDCSDYNIMQSTYDILCAV